MGQNRGGNGVCSGFSQGVSYFGYPQLTLVIGPEGVFLDSKVTHSEKDNKYGFSEARYPPTILADVKTSEEVKKIQDHTLTSPLAKSGTGKKVTVPVEVPDGQGGVTTKAGVQFNLEFGVDKSKFVSEGKVTLFLMTKIETPVEQIQGVDKNFASTKVMEISYKPDISKEKGDIKSYVSDLKKRFGIEPGKIFVGGEGELPAKLREALQGEWGKFLTELGQ